MDNRDIFTSIAELCHISSSQEELLKRSGFAGEPEPVDGGSVSDESGRNDDSIPVESTGIMMISPPESPDNDIPRDNNDVFHTPPEESTLATSQEYHHQTVKGDNKEIDSRTVDLGRDTDLEFSTEEVELTERIEIDSCSGKYFRVSKGELDSSNSLLCESSPVKILERAVKSTEKLKSSSKKSKLFHENLDMSPSNSSKWPKDRESNGDSSAKRKLEFYTRGEVESDLEQHNGTEEIDSERCLDANSSEMQKERESNSIDDIDKFRYVRPTNANSLEKQKDVRAERQLPMSIRLNHGYAVAEMVPDDVPSPKPNEEVAPTVFDVLRMLSEGYNYNPDLENLSVFEVAKRRGITFP